MSASPRSPARPPVLVLDGHTNQALACVRSLGRAGHQVLVASHRRWPLAAWSAHCHQFHRIAGQTRGAFATLRAWARERGAQCVLPVTERSCLLCNADRAAWEAGGVVVGCGPQSMLRRAFDKVETLRHAKASGLRLPPTLVPSCLDDCYAVAERIGYPCVVKPRFSNVWDGGRFLPDRGVHYARDPRDLVEAVQAARQGAFWPLIQRFVPGRGVGLFALCHRGRPLTWFAHERLRDVRPAGAGSSLRRSIPLEPRLLAPAERLVASLDWDGPVMVEVRDDGQGTPWLIEVNGRFWGSLQLAVAAGADFPRWWVALLFGRSLGDIPSYQAGVTVRWVWGDVKRLLNIFAGPPRGYPHPYPSVRQGLWELLGRQPPGTRVETWDRRDPWPVVGEWVQGVGDIIGARRARRAARPRQPATWIRKRASSQAGSTHSGIGQGR